MAKKRKQKQEEVVKERQPSKQEKQMFNLASRAHDKYGNPVWKS